MKRNISIKKLESGFVIRCLHKIGVFLLIGILGASCSGDPEPYEAFLGSYSAQKFCNDDESFISEITPGALVDQIIWLNAAGEEGAVDDLMGTVTGTSIVLPKQSIGGGLEMSATGTLLENGNIDLNTTVFAGSISLSCRIGFESL